jgi:tetratricopeptide (TPR) repeat protein
MLQNLGSTGGRIVPLHEYNYDKLVEWFFLTDSLDPKSNFISRLAAYYYGSSQDKEDLRKLLVFLEKQGTANTGRKWLLLVYGMKIARYELGDMDKALHFANLLANLDNPDMPDWTRRAPAIILSAKGDKEAAYRILVNLLKSEGEKIHPNEVNFIVHHICEDLLSSVEAINNPVCRNIYR